MVYFGRNFGFGKSNFDVKVKRITIKDVARATGVSDTTVSWVLKDHPVISKDTKKRILEYINKSGYKANILARSLRCSKTNIIGVLLNDVSNPFYAKILTGIESRAKSCGYNILLCNTNWESANEQSMIEIMSQYNVDGILATPTEEVSDCYLDLSEKQKPFVFIDTAVPGVNSNYVINDMAATGYIAGRYLVKLGHKKIVHITGEIKKKNFSSFVEGIRGYKKALGENGIVFHDNMICYGGLTVEAGYSAMQKILKGNYMPTAIFAVNDLAATGVMSAADEAGLRIPDDISIIGIDNSYLGAIPRISMDTVAESEIDMGRKAVEILMDNIAANEAKSNFRPIKIRLKPKIIKRGSCRKIGEKR